jgi:hypothetical protein
MVREERREEGGGKVEAKLELRLIPNFEGIISIEAKG